MASAPTDTALLLDGESLTLHLARDNVWCLLCRRQFKCGAQLDVHLLTEAHAERVNSGLASGRIAPAPPSRASSNMNLVPTLRRRQVVPVGWETMTV